MKKLALVFTVVFVFFNSSTFAWSRDGHHIVAEVAFQLLSPSAKDKLKALLGNTSIDDASTWMDEQRGGNNEYKYLTSTHFINIEKGGKLDPFQKGNIYTQLNTTIHDLENPNMISEGKYYLSLLILIHLVGDVHQPLHDGYASDKGGNSVSVSLMGKSTNLHSAWDGGIIQLEHMNSQTIMNQYAKLNPAQVNNLKNINPGVWIAESRSNLDQIYAFSNGTLDESYVQKATPIIENQLLKAGVRLAAILEKVLTTGGPQIPIAKEKSAQPLQSTQTPVTAAEAKDYIGKKITVCDKVFGTRFLESANGQPTFLNLGAAYPASPFTIVIFGQDRPNFKEKPELFYNNKKVCATGLIKEYNGKPEMVLTTESEIKIVD